MVLRSDKSFSMLNIHMVASSPKLFSVQLITCKHNGDKCTKGNDTTLVLTKNAKACLAKCTIKKSEDNNREERTILLPSAKAHDRTDDL